MRSSNFFILALFALVITGFLWGLYVIFETPLETGTAYPRYSTFRSDPMGARVLFEALRAHPGVAVARNEHNLLHIGPGQGSALIIAGAMDSPDPTVLIDALESFVSTGGRLVVTYLPDTHGFFLGEDDEPKSGTDEAGEEDAEKAEGDESASREELKQTHAKRKHGDEAPGKEHAEEGEEEEEEEKDTDEGEDFVNISERWGFELTSKELPNAEDNSLGSTMVFRAQETPDLPEELLWRSPQYFTELAGEWKTMYRRDALPVVVERAWDAGSIVLCSDSYFLSNEAMVNHRYAGLMTWLVGPAQAIVFDETHHGIRRDPGIVRLMRRYRLTPLLASLCVLALLFVWRSAVSLAPKHAGQAIETPAESGHSASAALNNLLRRSIPPQRLLAACIEAWRQDQGGAARQGQPGTQTKLEPLLREEVPLGDVGHRYNEIAATLQERGHR